MTHHPVMEAIFQPQLGGFNKKMGMFDYVIIPKSRLLGIDEKIDKYLSLVNEPEVSLQTKDLDNFLARYFIRDDSLFYENRNHEWVKSDS